MNKCQNAAAKISAATIKCGEYRKMRSFSESLLRCLQSVNMKTPQKRVLLRSNSRWKRCPGNSEGNLLSASFDLKAIWRKGRPIWSLMPIGSVGGFTSIKHFFPLAMLPQEKKNSTTVMTLLYCEGRCRNSTTTSESENKHGNEKLESFL